MADPENTLKLETTKGDVVIEMRPDLAPGHVARIKELVREGFYDGIVFHRVIDGFMAQTGCPQGTGTGGSGKKLKAEFNAEPHVRGVVSMARAQSPDSGDSQFFIVLRRRDLPRPAIHGLGQGDRRAWRMSTRSSAASRCAIPTRSSRRRSRRMRKLLIASPEGEGRPPQAVGLGVHRLANSACRSCRRCAPAIDRPCRGRYRIAMRTSLFDFDLPPERIALRPASPRDSARLMVVRPGEMPETEDRIVRDLPDLLRAGDALVVNDTKVIPARLFGRRIGRGEEPKIEATLHKRLDGSRWLAFVKPAKRLQQGDIVRFGDEGKVCFLGQLDATVEHKGEGGRGDAVVCLSRRGAGSGDCRARRDAAAALYRRQAPGRRTRR